MLHFSNCTKKTVANIVSSLSTEADLANYIEYFQYLWPYCHSHIFFFLLTPRFNSSAANLNSCNTF